MKYINVLVSANLNCTLTYASESNVEIGNVVLVPMRARVQFGVVVECNITPSCELDRIRVAQITHYTLSPYAILLISRLSKYYITSLGLVAKLFLMCSKKVQQYEFTNEISIANDYTLSSAQQDAYHQLRKNCNHYYISLLHGYTGSGKTTVYCHLINNILQQHQQCQILILVPEITLAIDAKDHISRYIQHRIIDWHSDLTKKDKHARWSYVENGNPCVVIGTRSALFLPFKSLKLIVVDEEHDCSFKQQHGVAYNARDVAVLLGSMEKFPVILSSATPSLESLYNAKIEKYKLVKLFSRFHIDLMPKISVVGINKGYNWMLSDQIIQKILYYRSLGLQSAVFLNARGYLRISICRECEEKAMCPNCSVCLVMHEDCMMCHHCQYKESISSKCKFCNGAMRRYGVGVDKLAQEISARIPDIKSIVLSTDSIKTCRASIFKQALNAEIIIGTQVISKGFNFPKLNFICVIDNNFNLMTDDFRALEKTHQMIYQISGRSGRFTQQGEVYIQSPNTKSALLRSVAYYDQDSFYEYLFRERKLLKLPPFYRVIELIAQHSVQKKAQEVADSVYCTIMQLKDCNVLAPIEDRILKFKNQYRYKIMLFYPKITLDHVSLKAALFNLRNIVKINVDCL